MLRRIGREAAIFTLFAALSIALTWPLAPRITTAVSDPGDPLLNAWILDWTCHALITQPFDLFDAPIFVPSLMPLAYSEHLTGIALLVLPLHLAGVPALALHNIAMLLAFALSGYGAFVLARMFVPSLVPPLIAGIFFAFVSFKFDHLPQVQVVSTGWIPLTLAALVAYWRRPTARNAALFAAAFVLNGLTNVYYLLFVSAALGMTLLFLLAAAPRRDRQFWSRLAMASVVAGLVLLPFLLPYRTVSKKYGLKRYRGEVMSNGWTAWMVAAPRSLLYGKLASETMRMPENSLFPGVLPLVLCAVALFSAKRVGDSITADDGQPVIDAASQRGSPVRLLRFLDVLIVVCAVLATFSLMTERIAPELFGVRLFAISGSDLPFLVLFSTLLLRLSIRLPRAFGGDDGMALRDLLTRSRFSTDVWIAAIWALTGFLGAFGMRTFFFSSLFRLEPYQSIRAVPRFAVVTYTGMVVFVALGAAVLLARRGAAMKSALVVLAIVDVLPSVDWQYVPSEVPPVYRWLAQKPVGPILELPVEASAEFHYLVGNTTHRVPLLNGTSGFEPPQHAELRKAWEEKRFADLFSIARGFGATSLIVHEHWLDDESKRALYDAVTKLALPAVQHFEHGGGADLVFRMDSST
ncbi:MAG TPA: hypothetical protein VE010_02945 [Thermoanaerobaculia bacterium]|nr:hypothetical protein [Thermoanaerobaculia bacterium]